MAAADKESDGPAPYSAAGFDLTQLPDYNDDFVCDDDFVQFARALAAPDPDPSTRPVQRRRNKTAAKTAAAKTTPAPRKDETREGFVYVVLKWPLLLFVLGWLLTLTLAYVLTRLYIFLYEHCVTWRGTRNTLRRRLISATTYQDWIHTATALDAHLGSDAWKEKAEYAYYDSKTVKTVYQHMAQLRQRAEEDEHATASTTRSDSTAAHHSAHSTTHSTPSDSTAAHSSHPPDSTAAHHLAALIEACVKHNFVGFENPRLYSETYYGTKHLVQHFVDEAAHALRFLRNTHQLHPDHKRALFKHVGTNFGRTALCLSGGATFAYYHYGLAKALLDADLLPQLITGTSGGALVSALLGTRTDDELKKLLVPALAHRIKASQDSTYTWITRWYHTGARFDAVQWGKGCAWMTRGSMTFKEAYQRTGRILNVSCVPADPHSPTILANYITTPDCVIWSAVLASAAVPGILNPVVLMKKDRDGSLSPYSFGHKWKDGSLRTDIPLKALNLHFNVRFSIVSQVNPHINIFFFSSRGSVGRPVTHRRGRGWRGGFIGSAIEQYLKLDLTKWLKVLRHLELLPRPLGQDWSEIWLQRFSGTITIWPKSIPSDFLHILSDPTPDRLARMIHVGQQSCFPNLHFIANRAKLEKEIQQGRRLYRTATTAGPTTGLTTAGLTTGLTTAGLTDTDPTGLTDTDSTDADLANLLSEDDLSEDDLDRLLKHTNSGNHAGTYPLDHHTDDLPDPSLSQRLTGWWSTMSPSTSSPNTHARTTARPTARPTAHPPAYALHDRPNSMFELRSPPDMAGFSRRRAVVGDGGDGGDDGDYGDDGDQGHGLSM